MNLKKQDIDKLKKRIDTMINKNIDLKTSLKLIIYNGRHPDFYGSPEDRLTDDIRDALSAIKSHL